MDFERDESHPNVFKMRPTADSVGNKLRREGPCYVCGAPTSYRYCGRHARYGDAWLDKQFRPFIRIPWLTQLWQGDFWSERVCGGKGILRDALNFTCPACLDALERAWGEREAQLKVERDKRSKEFSDWCDEHGL